MATKRGSVPGVGVRMRRIPCRSAAAVGGAVQVVDDFHVV